MVTMLGFMTLNRVLFRNTISAILILGFGVASLVAADQTSKRAIPEQAAQDASRSEIDEIFATDKARLKSAKRELAARLLKAGRDTDSDSAARYVLLDMARELALKGGDIRGALAALTVLDSEFNLDVFALRKESLSQAAAAVGLTSADKLEIVAAGGELIRQYIVTKDRRNAEQLTALMAAISTDLRDVKSATAFQQQHDDLIKLGEGRSTVLSALKALKTNKDDRTANATVGRFLVIANDDWGSGMAYLAKANDQGIAQMAQQEIAGATEVADELKLADGWFVQGELSSDRSFQEAILGRSMAWYQKALPNLAGLSRVKAEKRIEKLAGRGIAPADLSGKINATASATISIAATPMAASSTVPTSSAPTSSRQTTEAAVDIPVLNEGIRDTRWTELREINLLNWVEPERDQIRGEWKLDDGLLVSPSLQFARLRLPAIAPPQYDLELEVEPLDGTKNMVLVLSAPMGQRFMVQLHGYREFEHHGLDLIDGKPANSNETHRSGQILHTGRKNKIVVAVRRGRIIFTVNGQEVVNWTGNHNRLSAHKSGGWEEPGHSAIVIGTFQSRFAFHSVVLKPIVGRLPEPPEIPTRLAGLSSVNLDDLPQASFRVGYGTLGRQGRRGRPAGKSTTTIGTLFDGEPVQHALVLHPYRDGYAHVTYHLNGQYRKFKSEVGLSEQTLKARQKKIKGRVTFQVYGDGKLLAQEGNFQRRSNKRPLAADISGVNTLTLVVRCRGISSSAWGTWLDPTLEK
jgi:hypothetical protein